MHCPYCEKEKCVPEIVYTHTELHGGGVKNFNCLHCGRVVKVLCERKIIIDTPVETNEESDWT